MNILFDILISRIAVFGELCLHNDIYLPMVTICTMNSTNKQKNISRYEYNMEIPYLTTIISFCQWLHNVT